MRVFFKVAHSALICVGFLSLGLTLLFPHPEELTPYNLLGIRQAAESHARRAVPVRDPQEDDWRMLGSCTSVDPELFFSEDQNEQTQARLVCLSCPVMETCRDYSMAFPELEGIWAGMDALDRAKYRPEWESQQSNERLKVLRQQQKERRDKENARPSAEARLNRRLVKAQTVYERLQNITGLDDGARQRYMQVCEAIISDPMKPATVLANRMGRSSTWFNSIMREACDATGVPYKVEG